MRKFFTSFTKFCPIIFDKLNILLFPIVSDKNLEKVCEICDGLIVTGSCIDIPPHYYNEEPIPEKNYDIDEFKLDKAAIELFSSANKPILGICGGLQSINVCFGGSLDQKIENQSADFCKILFIEIFYININALQHPKSSS